MSALAKPAEEIGGEMKPRGRRRDRALVLRIDRLIIVEVFLVGRAFAGDVGRQGQLTKTRDGFVEKGTGERKAEHHLPALLFLDHLRVEAHQFARRALRRFAEADAVADGELFCRSRESAPAIGALTLVQHDLDLGGGLLANAKAVEARGNDFGVVEHQHVARLQQIRQIANDPVVETGIRTHHQHPRGIARLHRAECDAAFGQFEIKEVDAHSNSSMPPIDHSGRSGRPE